MTTGSAKPLSFVEGWPILQEEAIDKLIHLVEGNSSNQFNSEEYMRIYTYPFASNSGLVRAESFYVEGEISLPEHFQRFYLLGCSECNHLVRSKIRREIQCINCRLPRMLIPRCHFEVEITDETGTITTTMSKGLGERILSMTAEQIYDITAVKNELFPVAHINQLLADKLFRIQLQRSSSRTPDKNAGSLVLLSYTEKLTMFLPEE
ncbi:uncharacterized protein LOC142161788 [Nicotiana tabacum]|uniref:Uncharacterized protein LOC142161788 n=1 Tax=Nicotiana tabacum TaxID=4097 RepID=A0AC58U7U9_TOBAC